MNKKGLLFHYTFEGDEMKKAFFVILSIVIGILVSQKNDEIIIPSDAIRVRIIANSNNVEDLYTKAKMKNEIKEDLYNLVKDASSSSEARFNIQKNLANIKELVGSKINDFKVDYGTNYFPQKTYKGVIYPEGNYESLVITLGSGLGENWWCVMYPPLCMIDDNHNTSDVNYRFLVSELLN